MCGIAGVHSPDLDRARIATAAMCDQMFARGPDDGGLETFAENGTAVVLGSRRLAIIDPSPAGHQPMRDPSRGTTLVFNGMIYNFADLRRQLADQGESFTSHCDAEVVLKAYGRWGERCVQRLRGMFSLAIWDGRQNQLFLARDRLGIKPLYYARTHSGEFLFASQIKGLLASGLIAPTLSKPAVRSFLEFGSVSEPLTAIEGVQALPAAHTAVLRDETLSLNRYWDFPESIEEQTERDDVVRGLRLKLEETVGRHLLSDVPLGVFLSGGTDSSVLAALAAGHTRKLRTISVVFDDAGYSEERYVDLMTARLRPEHVRVPLRAADLIAWAEDAFNAMDQPTYDGINTYVVSRAASRTGLKVALSGLGGDELFDGYGYARRVARLETARRVPAPLTRVAGRAVGIVNRTSRGTKVKEWLTGNFNGGSSYELLRRLFLPSDTRRLLGSDTTAEIPAAPRIDPREEIHRQVSILDLTNYTKNVLLRDTDAMSMAQSLEVRVPFLDHELVEWVVSLPAEVKQGKPKALLVDAVRDLLPTEIVERPKQGFLLPIGRWMQNELRGDIERTLAAPPQAMAELIDPEGARRIWKEYLERRRTWLQPWSVYALARWVETLH